MSFVLTGMNITAQENTKVVETLQERIVERDTPTQPNNIKNILKDTTSTNNYFLPERNDTTLLEELVENFKFYEDQIEKHSKHIQHYVEEYSTFDTTHSSKEKLLQFSYALFTQESRLKQINTKGQTLKSIVEAKGVGQFRKLGLEQVNEYKKTFAKKDSNYAKIKKFDYETAIKPTPKGGEENIRAGVLLLKILLEKYKGDWKLASAEYNMGMTKLNATMKKYGTSFEAIKEHIPQETKTYVQKIGKYMSDFENIKQYKKKLLENYAFGLIARTNLKGNKARDLSFEKELYYTQILQLDKAISKDEIFSKGDKYKRLITHAKYELGKALYSQGRYEIAQMYLTSVQKGELAKGYEKKGSAYLMRRIEREKEKNTIADAEETTRK